MIQHSVEILQTALVSNHQDLVEGYSKYTEEERHLLEEGLHPGPTQLFQYIAVHSDSDWIPAHPEKPQDFESFYKDSYRKIPSASHNTIYIQTIGSFGDAGVNKDRYVEWLREYCQAFFYGLSVKLLPAVSVAETGCTFRVNTNSHNLQILTGDLLRFLGHRKPKDAFCIVGITMIDLYPKESWNFVFGEASLNRDLRINKKLTALSPPQLCSAGPSPVEIGEGCIRKGIRHKNLSQINTWTMIRCGDPELKG
ncbi:Archaemetzincin-2 [Channa argus]|uniref:Archaemetzincin-2 n=1 Tax=Channa argus TaxID=215402 RepID=A0A6G1QQH5_CHAAH|nr:Archaemetzincin-2 [Channa argus]